MERYTSALLFHGPSARETSLKEVSRWGRLLRDPIGEEGLKIAEARELCELIDQPPVGDVPGVLVVGPMCKAGRGVPDVLLKTLEEFDPRRVRPLLWAEAEAEVSPTIRSRCLMRWCPGHETLTEELLQVGRRLVEASLERDIPGVIETLKDQEPSPILRAATFVLGEQIHDVRAQALWGVVREALTKRDISVIEVLATFLPEGS